MPLTINTLGKTIVLPSTVPIGDIAQIRGKMTNYVETKTDFVHISLIKKQMTKNALFVGGEARVQVTTFVAFGTFWV